MPVEVPINTRGYKRGEASVLQGLTRFVPKKTKNCSSQRPDVVTRVDAKMRNMRLGPGDAKDALIRTNYRSSQLTTGVHQKSCGWVESLLGAVAGAEA